MNKQLNLKESDLIEHYQKESKKDGCTYHQTKFTELGKLLFDQAKQKQKNMLLDIRETKYKGYIITWQVIPVFKNYDLNDVIEVEIKKNNVVETILHVDDDKSNRNLIIANERKIFDAKILVANEIDRDGVMYSEEVVESMKGQLRQINHPIISDDLFEKLKFDDIVNVGFGCYVNENKTIWYKPWTWFKKKQL